MNFDSVFPSTPCPLSCHVCAAAVFERYNVSGGTNMKCKRNGGDGVKICQLVEAALLRKGI